MPWAADSWPPVRSSDHVALGRAVRELRERRGLQQIAVAFDAGVEDRYFGRVERGTINVTFGLLLRVVRTLGFSLAELVEVYERHLAEIDPRAGDDVPRCPSPEATEHVRHRAEEARAAYYATKARRARSRIRPWT